MVRAACPRSTLFTHIACAHTDNGIRGSDEKDKGIRGSYNKDKGIRGSHNQKIRGTDNKRVEERDGQVSMREERGPAA